MQRLQVPNVPVPFSIVVLIHFFFTSNVLLTSDFDLWIPSFLFTHVVVILIGLWAAQDRKVLEPIIAYIVAVAISILMDIIQLGVYFADAQDRANGDSDREIDGYPRRYRDTWRYAAGMMIIHLILKPLCILFALLAGFMRYRGVTVDRTEYDRIENQQ